MQRKKDIIILMCVFLCILAVGYSAFNTNFKINGTASIASTWKIVFTKIEEINKSSGVTVTVPPTASGTMATFSVDLKNPGDTIIYQITVSNQGTLDAIIENITATETGSDAVVFEITNIKEGDVLEKQASTTFLVKISYNEEVTTQPEIVDNKLTVEVDFTQNLGQEIIVTSPVIEKKGLAYRVLQDNIAQSDVDIDFSAVSSDTNGKGLYYTSTDTEDNKIMYYFRGNVTNNYVKFGKQTRNYCKYAGREVAYLDLNTGTAKYNSSEAECLSTNVCDNSVFGSIVGANSSICSRFGGVMTSDVATFTANVYEDILWRIIRINEDGSIRMITQSPIGTSAFNSKYNDNAYVGYMYGTAGSSTYALTHLNTNDSTIKSYLDDWYEKNLKDNYGKYLADAGFCNDRSFFGGTGIGTSVTKYGSYKRLYSGKTPSFSCPNEDDDLFTTKSSDKGNKALTYPIGLITADEISYAGEIYDGTNENYYLNNDTIFWTMTPISFSSTVNALEWIVGNRLDYELVSGGFGVRPVINLSSSVEIIRGNGTIGNEYIIKTN